MTSSPSAVEHSRREWLRVGSVGLGSLLLSGLTPNGAKASLLSPKAPHSAPKAKRVIFLFINGGPSQFESFDYKPELAKRGGKKGIKKGKLLPPQLQFARHGESGTWVSEAFPNLAK